LPVDRTFRPGGIDADVPHTDHLILLIDQDRWNGVVFINDLFRYEEHIVRKIFVQGVFDGARK
jgi:hypothetical protein